MLRNFKRPAPCEINAETVRGEERLPAPSFFYFSFRSERRVVEEINAGHIASAAALIHALRDIDLGPSE